MTTLVGIVARKEKPGVVLASDISRTQTSWQAQGDVAYRQQTRSEGQKIHISDDKRLAICMSGIFDQLYVNFLSGVLSGKVDVEKAIAEGKFDDLKQLNESRWGGRVPNNEEINGLLLAVRFGGMPKLYTCYPLGYIEEREWTSVGSGSGYALNHIVKQGKLIPHYLTVPEAIWLAKSSLDEAAQDIYTGGLDIAVVTPEDIEGFGELIRKNVSSIQNKTIEEISQKY